MVQIQNNFTELFFMMPSTKIAQMVPLRWTKELPELKKRNIFKRHHDTLYQNCTNGSTLLSKKANRALKDISWTIPGPDSK